MTRLEVIAAVSDNGVIGNKGRIPWHIPQDLENFRRITTGHAVVMGRKTWESLQAIKRAPLPNRTNIVVSSQMESSPDVTVVRSLAEARALGHPLLFVIGGAALYAEALPLADVVHLTRVLAVYPGDAFFPPWDAAGFGLVGGFDVRTPRRPDRDFSYLHYVRCPALIPRPAIP